MTALGPAMQPRNAVPCKEQPCDGRRWHLNVRNALSDPSQLMETVFLCLQVHIGQMYSTDKLIIENQETPRT